MDDRERGGLIRQLRTAKGLTQADLAILVGVLPQQVQRWEGGAQTVSRRHRVKLAKRLGVTLESLFPAE